MTTTMTINPITDNMFNGFMLFSHDDGTFTKSFYGTLDNGAFFTVRFTNNETEVRFSDNRAGDHTIVVTLGARKHQDVEMAKILYIACAGSLEFSNKIPSNLVNNLYRHFDDDMYRVVYHDNIRQMTKEFFSAA